MRNPTEIKNLKYPKLFKKTERGIALVTTLLITAILTALTVEFIYRVYIGAARAEIFKDTQRAGVLAQDGVMIAKSGLEELIKVKPAFTMEENGLAFSRSVGDGAIIEIRAFDELSKASIMVVFPATGLSNKNAGQTYSRLLRLLGLDERLKDTLADWIDKDSEISPFGAEAADYSSLAKPYTPKNNMLESTEEMLMIKGYTPEVFKKLAPFVTPYTEGLVNINTAGKTVLMSLSDDIPEGLAERVIEYRGKTPFKERSEILKVPGFETIGFSLQDKITARTNTFRVLAKARVNGVERGVEAVIQAGGGILYWREM